MHLSRSCLLVTIASIAAACGDDASSSDGDGTGAGGPGATTTTSAGPGVTSSSSSTSSGAGGEAEGGGGGGPPTGTPVLVAVGYGGRRTSSLDGVTWENDTIVDPNGGDDDNLFRGVGFGNGTFIAVGGAGVGQIATSTNGAQWTFQAPVSSWLGDVAFQNGVFVTAGGNGLRLRSSDGVTWTDDAGYYAGHYRGIAAGNGVFVAAGHTYGGGDVGLISTTTDGVTWTPEQTGGGTYGSIAFGAGVFVAVGNDRCSVSADGATWSDCSIEASDFGRVVYGDGVFAMRTGDGIYTSADGTTWAAVASQNPPQGLLGQGIGMWIGGNWPDDLFASSDLASWDDVFGGTGPAFVDVQVGYVE